MLKRFEQVILTKGGVFKLVKKDEGTGRLQASDQARIMR